MFESKQTAAVCGLVLCFVLAGCGGILAGDDDQLNDDATTADVDVATMERHASEVDRYRIERTRTLRSEGVNETVEIDGAVDVEFQRARLSMRTHTDVGTGIRTTETEQYVDGDTRYTKRGDSGEWERSEGAWSETETYGDAVSTLRNVSFDPVRTETIGGVETTMFRVGVDESRWSEIAGADGSRHAGVSIEELVYYVYVDTETDTLYGTDLRMEVTQGGGPAIVTAETLFADHDGEIDVSTPTDIEASKDDEE